VLETIKLPQAEQQKGIDIVKQAIVEPLRWIAKNAGFDGSIVIEKVKNEKGGFGFNAQTEQYEDLTKAGVIDPTKVVRCALQNAASVASLLITTEAMIAEKPKKESGMPPMPPGGMGGMGGMDY
jgi:chaperonin GroEL